MQTWNLPGPVYYRLGKDDKLLVPELAGRFEMSRCQLLGEGLDILLVAMGNVVAEAVAARDLLAAQGVNATVAVVSCFNPSPLEHLAELLPNFKMALSIESHYLTGGVGSLVAEVIAERGIGCRLVRCGIRDMPNGVSGSQNYLHESYGLTAPTLAATALEHLSGK